MRASWKIVLAAVLAVAPCSSGKETSPAVDGDDELVAVEGSDGPLELVKLLEISAEVTGEPFFFDPAALHGLRAQPIEAKAIPRRRLLAYLDDQLCEQDFVTFESVVAGVRVHSVVAAREASRHSRCRNDAEYVPPEELASLEDRGKIVKSSFTFRSLGVADGAQHVVCYRFSDSVTSALRLIQGSGSYTLVGTASNVAQVVALMRELDASAIRSEMDEKHQAEFDALDRRVGALEAALAGR